MIIRGHIRTLTEKKGRRSWTSKTMMVMVVVMVVAMLLLLQQQQRLSLHQGEHANDEMDVCGQQQGGWNVDTGDDGAGDDVVDMLMAVVVTGAVMC